MTFCKFFSATLLIYDVKVTRFQPAEGSTDSITTRQLFVFSLIQLAQSGVLYAIIAFIVLCAALIVYLKRRKKVKEDNSETVNANES